MTPAQSQEPLKECPFCGKDAQYDEDMDAITCADTEGGCGFYYNVEGELKDTIKLWNTRVHPPTPQGKIEEK